MQAVTGAPVASPSGPRLGWIRHAALASFWFGLNFHWLPIGFVLAGIREFRGTLLPAMAAHAFNNFIAMTFLVIALG